MCLPICPNPAPAGEMCLYSVSDEGPRTRRKCDAERRGGVRGRVQHGELLFQRTKNKWLVFVLKPMHGDKGRRGREGKLTPLPLSSSSSLHRCHSPAPPKSAVRTRRSSKNRCAGAQSSCCGSRAHPPSSCQSEAYISCASALSAARCRQGRGRTECARRIPREERRKPRWPCSEVWRR